MTKTNVLWDFVETLGNDVRSTSTQQSRKGCTMKGISLPTNMLVIVIIVVIVLLALGAFLLSSAGTQGASADANKIFAEGCLRYCTPSPEQNYLNTYEIKKNDQQFLDACVQLGYGSYDFPVQCLQQCGCDLTTSQGEINSRLQELVTNIETS